MQENTWKIIESPLNPNINEIMQIVIFNESPLFKNISLHPFVTSKRADMVYIILFSTFNFSKTVSIILNIKWNISIHENIFPRTISEEFIASSTISKVVLCST